jgi:hypothetical protein
MDRNNKNKYGNEGGLKDEQQLISELRSILHNKYGYSPDQMGHQVHIGSDSQKIADLVVFDENKSPIIIVEVTKNRSILPLSEYQLRELRFDSKARRG